MYPFRVFTSGEVTPVTPVVERPAGGYFPDIPKRSAAKVREERERLGILPKVSRIIVETANRYAEDTQQRLTDAQKVKALKTTLAKEKIAWEAFYAQVLLEQEQHHRSDLIRAALIAAGVYRKNEELQAQAEMEMQDEQALMLLMMDFI